MPELDPATHTGQVWTADRVVEALCDWTILYGQPPTCTELSDARAADPAPSHLKAWPPPSALFNRFGSTGAAIEAAEAAQPAHFAARAAQFRANAQRARTRTLMRMNNKETP
jgi:hypothetical protein